eukprot:TRINITY_DN7521_c0_g1_i2.p1 TRINITY_DN7521_c0_g1~~TRINITY_DN7521_c0_g1_i2.p1  ORF type:complete len:207 (-),score=42.35 TRINITY_DN7521_c0_g1_i2:47-667(-)
MNTVALGLLKEIQNARFAYLQSDEISILIFNPPVEGAKREAVNWFGNNVQKLVSVSASLAGWIAAEFQQQTGLSAGKRAVFDARVSLLPEEEINNYFIWRQGDWIRNSVQMLARKHYTHKHLAFKNSAAMKSMIKEKGEDWDELHPHLRFGRCFHFKLVEYQVQNEFFEGQVQRGKWLLEENTPIFAQQPFFVKKCLSESLQAKNK